jgi:hypothetical protein
MSPPCDQRAVLGFFYEQTAGYHGIAGRRESHWLLQRKFKHVVFVVRSVHCFCFSSVHHEPDSHDVLSSISPSRHRHALAYWHQKYHNVLVLSIVSVFTVRAVKSLPFPAPALSLSCKYILPYHDSKGCSSQPAPGPRSLSHGSHWPGPAPGRGLLPACTP